MGHAFVAGGSGFIGRCVVRALKARGERVVALARSDAGTRVLEAIGAEVIRGDLLTPGPWQDALARARHVVHLAQPATFGARVTRARARAYRKFRMIMDEHLLAALDPRTTERVVYVAGTSFYGDVGRARVDERARPRPRGWGPYLAPAIERLDGYVARGLPIVTAFPGYVYGDGSWFRQYVYRPLFRGKRVTIPGGRSRMGSPIHVEDCANAIVHLLDRGAIGARYFVVDDEPLEWSRFHARAAAAMGRELHVRAVPTLVLRALLGGVVVDSLLGDANLSNARLKSTGFALRFPTSADGISDVVAHARPPARR
jgi:nucleoside-diphosphate-sugar epimerase